MTWNDEQKIVFTEVAFRATGSESARGRTAALITFLQLGFILVVATE